MHKIFHGHWGSKIQKNNNENSKSYGQYYYTYDSSTKSGSTTSTENGQKTTDIAEVSTTVVYNTKQEKQTIEALRNTAEIADKASFLMETTGILLMPETGFASTTLELSASTAGWTSTLLNSYADFLEGHTWTGIKRIALATASFGLGRQIKNVKTGHLGKKVLEAHKVIIEKSLEKGIEDSDKKNYTPLKPNEL